MKSKVKVSSVTRIIVGFMMILLASIMLCSCRANRTKDVENTSNNQEEEKSESPSVLSETDNTEDEKISVETPFAVLSYSKQYNEKIRVEQIEAAPYTVKFYGCVSGKEDINLFDIIFGASDEYLLGTLQHDNEQIEVHVMSYEFNPDESWTDDQALEVYALKDQINMVIESLKSNNGFIEQ